jgi:hypothetical protein
MRIIDLSERRLLVSLRNPEGVAEQIDLDYLQVSMLEHTLPWRKFRWWRGQKHYPGLYWSSTVQRHISYESRLELARLLLADFDTTVTRIYPQAFLLTASQIEPVKQHVPDFLFVHSDRTVTVSNVKPAEHLDTSSESQALKWAHAAFAQHGWNTEIWSGVDPVMMANIRFLAGYRRHVVDEQLASLVLTLAPGRSIQQVETGLESIYPKPVVRAALLALLWQRRLQAELTMSLEARTILARAS